MNNKNSFEKIIKNKMASFEKNPPLEIQEQLNQQLSNRMTPKVSWKKRGVFLLVGFILAILFITLIVAQKNTKPSPSKDKKQIQVVSLNTPKDIKALSFIEARQKAKMEQKLIFITAFNQDCKYCDQMEEETFSNSEVSLFLENHFIRINIDLKDTKNNYEIIKYYDINVVPLFLFINQNGELIKKINGFREPEVFIAILENALEKEAAGEYLPIKSQTNKNKIALSKKLEIGIFPNPNNGKFNLEIAGKKEKITITIQDINGKQFLNKSYPEFNGTALLKYDFSKKNGYLVVQIIQGGERISKKVLIQ